MRARSCWWLVSITACVVACDPPPLRDVSTQGCIALHACGDTDTGVVATVAQGLTFEFTSRTTPPAPDRSPVTFRVRVIGGATRAPSVLLDFESQSGTLFTEPQEIHCAGDATRGPSPYLEGGERLVVVDPSCTRWGDSPGQRPYAVAQLVIDVALDGTVRVEPFDAPYRSGGTCSGFATTAIRIGAEHLVVTEPPS